MKREELANKILKKIADNAAMEKSYDWFNDVGPDCNELYSAAFLDGMKYMMSLLIDEDQE